ncbi:hypothetical protein DL769_010977 [Monosporascus sp. CRB-8-3]|nr:hypothetical protein DL769_010977 [Monosporascus sp. CRB-8-3]
MVRINDTGPGEPSGHAARGSSDPDPAAAIPGKCRTAVLPASKPREVQHECMYCGRRFTRKGTMWNCAERHLRRRKTEAVPRPDPECKSKGIVLENEMRFKNHARFSTERT